MAAEHSNPSEPRTYQKKQNNRPVGPPHAVTARAPYNFVPLPEAIVPAPELPAHHRYYADRLTGAIHCTLETRAPTYIRGMLTREQFRAQGRKKPKETTVAEKENQAAFFSYGDAQEQNFPRPVIPASSLRGLVRQLVEIAGHGRMRWVAERPTFTFRAVAAQGDDPLALPYQNALGKYGRNVSAGYLEKDGEEWFVQPAQTPKDAGWSRDRWDKWVKVVEEDMIAGDLPGFKPFDHRDYRPQIQRVSFAHGPRVPKTRRTRGKPDRPSIRVGPPGRYEFDGYLVTSGSMAETGGASPRRNHMIILARDRRRQRIPVPQETVGAYRKGLTPYQEEYLEAWAGGEWGVLAAGKPVFFVEEGGQVIYFGHSPNFRVPARLAGARRAATPRDFVPESMRNEAQPDLADAIFGWVEEEGSPAPVWGEREQLQSYAGRVFFEDARFVDSRGALWHREEAIIPKVLSAPKPTTFQHYLVQDATMGHDPDMKPALAHYGTSPDETQIRGYKLYWHKGENPDITVEPEADGQGGWKHESQYTRIRPLNTGVRFSFDIRFENLSAEELGALLWALAIPAEDEGPYYHKLGMGKPLGMGAVSIRPELHLSQRTAESNTGRYRKLFDGDRWNLPGERSVDIQPYLAAFTGYILRHLPETAGQFTQLERIQMLLEMLRWRDGDAAWLEQSRYMEIEHGEQGINEYVERPVLPDPLVVSGRKVPTQNSRRRPQQRQQRQEPPLLPAPAGKGGDYRQGTVKNWKGSYGFITPFEGGNDVFVHQSVLPRGQRSLTPGQRVRFRVVRSDRGLNAEDVTLE